MLNGKYPLLLINLGLIPIPIYIDENVFKIALRGEDKAVSLSTTKTGNFTHQTIGQNTLQLSFSVAKESQYGIIIISLLDKLYSIISNLYSKYVTSEGDSENKSNSISSFINSLGQGTLDTLYSVDYYSETETISDAVITSFTKITEAGSSEITITLTLEKKPKSIGGLSLENASSSIGQIVIGKGN